MQILILTAHYLPGYRAGGPLRTLANLVRALSREFVFLIVTSDHDLGERTPYAGVRLGAWTHVGEVDVIYCSRRALTIPGVGRILRDTRHDILYLNSLFDFRFSIAPLLLRRLWLVPRGPVILAPRGECGESALGIRAWKKRPFLWVARLIGLHLDVLWHVSSEREAADVLRVFGPSAKVCVAADLPADPSGARPRASKVAKASGKLQLLFLSRISPMKNLDFALEVLRGVSGAVRFQIAGPIESESYWRRCQTLIASLPRNVTVSYLGALDPVQVHERLEAAELLFLPTRGENFGHIIFEALSAGCPVLVSDRTIWRNLNAEGVGWDLPLEEPLQFRNAIEQMIAADAEQLQSMARNSLDYAIRWFRSADPAALTRAVFEQAHAMASGTGSAASRMQRKSGSGV